MANIHHCLNPHCPDRAGGIRDRLLKTLREASLPDLNNKRNRFIPRTELIRLVDQQVVSQFLQLSDSSLKEGTAQETTVNRICTEEGQCGCGKHWCTGARILFVALALLGSERQILRLFDKYKRSDELCDSNPHPESFLADGLGNDVLTDWSKEKRELFVQVQWRMRSPYVGYTPEDKFCGSCSLPWIEREEDRKPKLGGFSRVRRIKIHPGHHNMAQKTNNGSFALKTLNHTEKGHRCYETEVRAYHQITNPHNHITPLLTAFHHGETRCLVFPWADGGDLADLFEKNPAQMAWCNAEWVWKACLGISKGLRHLHQPLQTEPPPSEEGKGSESATKLEKTSVPKLHADIKPENILCFSNKEETPYTLRLADLGLARPSSDPKEVKCEPPIHTLTYRPPEQDLDAKFATSQWDTWALGCLFLEFVTWFLQGPTALEEFRGKREEEFDHPRASGVGASRIFEDTFFRVGVKNRVASRLPGVDVIKKAKVKGCVITHIQALNALKDKSKCTENLRDLLRFIEENMLVVDPTKRATAEKVVQFFKSDTESQNNNVAAHDLT